MKTYVGELAVLGNGSQNGKEYTYSTIEIGDHVLQKMVAINALHSFLCKAVKLAGTTELYVKNKIIIGVKLSDGKLYCYDNSPIALYFGLLIGVMLIPVFGIGLIPTKMASDRISALNAAKELKARGAIPCSY